MRGDSMTEDVVIIPTYNEASNIETLVRDVVDGGLFSAMIVDDGSPDGTGDIADALSRRHPDCIDVLHRARKDGLGAAYRAGFHHVLTTPAKRIYQMDADLSHDPGVLPDLRDALLDGHDLAIGSRYVAGGGVVGWPLRRQLLSRAGSLYAGVILGLAQRDLTGGFKGWKREALEAIRPATTKSDGYAFQIETTHRATRAGARVVEIPITFHDRRRGASKMGWPIVLEAIRVVPALRLRHHEAKEFQLGQAVTSADRSR
jgi:dolichol-phosphate mannosyltransferase